MNVNRPTRSFIARELGPFQIWDQLFTERPRYLVTYVNEKGHYVIIRAFTKSMQAWTWTPSEEDMDWFDNNIVPCLEVS